MAWENKKYNFQSFMYCPATNALQYENKEVVILEQRVADLLDFLCKHPHQILRKDLILSEVWAGRIVNEDSLSVAVSKLRKHLRDNRNDPEFLKTIPGVGYQWLQRVELINEGIAEEPRERLDWQTKKPVFSISIFVLGLLIIFALLVHQFSMSGFMHQNETTLPLSEEASAALRLGQRLVNTPGAENYREAITAFREVLDDYPENTSAHIGIVLAKLRLSALNGYMDYLLYKDENEAILNFVEEIDESYAPLWQAKAWVAFVSSWDIKRAIDYYEKAIELSSENSRLYLGYSELLITLGKFDKAETQLQELRLRDPSLYRYLNLAFVYMMRGDYDRALAETQRLLNTEVTSRSHFHMLQRIGILVGDDEMIIDSLKVLLRQQNADEAFINRIEKLYATEGRVSVFRYLAENEVPYNVGHFIPPLSIARYYVITEDYDKAIEKIKEAINARQLQVLMLDVDPFYEPLRTTEGYAEIIRNLGMKG